MNLLYLSWKLCQNSPSIFYSIALTCDRLDHTGRNVENTPMTDSITRHNARRSCCTAEHTGSRVLVAACAAYGDF